RREPLASARPRRGGAHDAFLPAVTAGRPRARGGTAPRAVRACRRTALLGPLFLERFRTHRRLAMTKRIVAGTAAMGVLISIATGCAVRPVVDPRNPAPVRDGPVVLTVCYVDGDGAHLAVGDRIELTANKLGRLRIRHLPAA